MEVIQITLYIHIYTYIYTYIYEEGMLQVSLVNRKAIYLQSLNFTGQSFVQAAGGEAGGMGEWGFTPGSKNQQYL